MLVLAAQKFTRRSAMGGSPTRPRRGLRGEGQGGVGTGWWCWEWRAEETEDEVGLAVGEEQAQVAPCVGRTLVVWPRE